MFRLLSLALVRMVDQEKPREGLPNVVFTNLFSCFLGSLRNTSDTAACKMNE